MVQMTRWTTGTTGMQQAGRMSQCTERCVKRKTAARYEDIHNAAAFTAIGRIRVVEPNPLGQTSSWLILEVVYHSATPFFRNFSSPASP